MSSKQAVLQWRDLPPAPPRKKKSGRGAQNQAPNGYGEGASGAFSDHEHTKIGGTFCPFFPGLLSQGRMSKIDLKIDREIEGSGAESGGPGPSQATSRRVRCLDRGLPRGDKPLWLGANNPTPGLRKTLTAPASRRGPWSLGACALGAPTSGGEKSASSAKEI